MKLGDEEELLMEQRLGGRYLQKRAINPIKKGKKNEPHDPLDQDSEGSLLSSINKKIHNKYEIDQWLQGVEDDYRQQM